MNKNNSLKIACLLISFFGYSHLFAQQKILAIEANKYVGKIVKICDLVAGTKHLINAGNLTLLNMGGNFPNHAFTIVIDGDARKNFEGKPEQYYLNKEICVSGKIELYKGKPQMRILSPLDVVMISTSTSGEKILSANITSNSTDTATVVNFAAKEFTKTVSILKKNMEVWSGPGKSFELVKILKAGQAVEVLYSRNGWSQVKYKDQNMNSKKDIEGFIESSLLK